MKPESSEITPDEYLLRRVHRNVFPKNGLCITTSAFVPRIPGRRVRDVDETGISLYRESCLSDPTDILVLIDESKRGDNGIVRIPVALLNELGLTILPASVPGIPGHVVIYELRAERYLEDKQSVESILARLADAATDGIVLMPSDS